MTFKATFSPRCWAIGLWWESMLQYGPARGQRTTYTRFNIYLPMLWIAIDTARKPVVTTKE